jgi:hypothetical protein
VHVEAWASQWAVEEVFGIESSLLNDDRIGWALNAVAPHLGAIVGSIGARAITEFGLDLARLHWDMTSICLHGDYDATEAASSSPAVAIPRTPEATCWGSRAA